MSLRSSLRRYNEAADRRFYAHQKRLDHASPDEAERLEEEFSGKDSDGNDVYCPKCGGKLDATEGGCEC